MVRVSGKRGKCSDPNLLPQNIKKGVTILGVTGALEYEDPDLVPGNVRKGVNIFGVTGTFEGGTKLQQLNRRLTDGGTFTVDFTPKMIFGLYAGNANTDARDYILASFQADSSSPALHYQKSNLSQGRESYTRTARMSDAVTWGTNSVSIKHSKLNGRYDIFIMG